MKAYTKRDFHHFFVQNSTITRLRLCSTGVRNEEFPLFDTNVLLYRRFEQLLRAYADCMEIDLLA